MRLHAEWALGLDRFAELRQARLAAGVPERAEIDAIVGDQGLVWTFKFAASDGAGLTSTSAIKIVQDGADVRVEHLVVRESRRERSLAPEADSPEVVRWMLEHTNGIMPAELVRTGTARIVEEADTAAIVDDALAPERTLPIIIVAVENAMHTPLVSEQELARRLAGMAVVHRLVSVRASYRLRDALASRGMSEKLGCYNGGVRVLWPTLTPRDDPYDHLLLLPVRILAMPTAVRTAQVAGTFCELIAENEDLRRWLRDVEGVSRPPERPPIAVTPLAVSVPEPPRPPPARPPIAERAPPPPPVAEPPIEPEVAEVAEVAPPPEPEQAPPPPPPVARPKSTWAALADDLAAGFQLADEQERELEGVRADLAGLRKELRRAEQERDEIKGSLGPPRTVTGALARADALFADRLLVLRSARASAEDSPYRDAPRVFFVLALLAHCDPTSIGDVIQRTLGGQARWKPKDSPETLRAFGRDRTFVDSTGTPKLFGRHITLGHGVSALKCLQIYYDVLADGRIEIAWCGEHRPTVGEDT